MKKMKLGPEELAVESFEVVAAGDGGEGTVHTASIYSKNPDDTCYPGLCTCNETCEGIPTCNFSECITCDADAAG